MLQPKDHTSINNSVIFGNAQRNIAFPLFGTLPQP